MLETKALKGRNHEAIAAACLYIACRKEGVPRTFKGTLLLLSSLLLTLLLLLYIPLRECERAIKSSIGCGS